MLCILFVHSDFVPEAAAFAAEVQARLFPSVLWRFRLHCVTGVSRAPSQREKATSRRLEALCFPVALLIPRAKRQVSSGPRRRIAHLPCPAKCTRPRLRRRHRDVINAPSEGPIALNAFLETRKAATGRSARTDFGRVAPRRRAREWAAHLAPEIQSSVTRGTRAAGSLTSTPRVQWSSSLKDLRHDLSLRRFEGRFPPTNDARSPWKLSGKRKAALQRTGPGSGLCFFFGVDKSP